MRINEFNIDTESYTGANWRYKLAAQGANIGDMTAINAHEFVVIERNGATATGGGTPLKKIFRIDMAPAGFVIGGHWPEHGRRRGEHLHGYGHAHHARGLCGFTRCTHSGHL